MMLKARAKKTKRTEVDPFSPESLPIFLVTICQHPPSHYYVFEASTYVVNNDV